MFYQIDIVHNVSDLNIFLSLLVVLFVSTVFNEGGLFDMSQSSIRPFKDVFYYLFF